MDPSTIVGWAARKQILQAQRLMTFVKPWQNIGKTGSYDNSEDRLHAY